MQMEGVKRCPHSVLIVSGSEKGFELFREILPEYEFDPIVTVKSAGEARRNVLAQTFDIVIINSPLTDEVGKELAVETADSGYCGVLLLVKSEFAEQTEYEAAPYGILTLSKPVTRQVLMQSVRLCVATRERMKKVEQKTANLQAKMNEIRIINRAKWILIGNLHMTEEEAHRYIEKSAMDTRRTRTEIAESIIRTYEN